MFHEPRAGAGEPVNLPLQHALRVGRDAADVYDGVQAIGGMMVGEVRGALPIETRGPFPPGKDDSILRAQRLQVHIELAAWVPIVLSSSRLVNLVTFGHQDGTTMDS